MKWTLTTLMTGLILQPAAVPGVDKVTPNATNHFLIRGMHCEGCAGGIGSELRRLPGVLSAQISFSNRLAIVCFDTNKVSPGILIRTIKEAGFEASAMRPEMNVPTPGLPGNSIMSETPHRTATPPRRTP